MSLRSTIRSTGGLPTIRKGIDSLDAGIAFDPDAVAWINARVAVGDPMTTPQKQAVVAFVMAEKAAGRWASMKRLYLFTVLGNAAANAIDLVSLTTGTFIGGMAHFTGYSQSNGTTGYFSTNVTPGALGLTPAAVGMGYISLGGESLSVQSSVIGCQVNTTTQLHILHNTSVGLRFIAFNTIAGSITQGSSPATYASGLISGQRFAGGRYITRRSESSQELINSNTSADGGSIPAHPIFIFTTNLNGAPSSQYSTGKLGAAFICLGWSQADNDAFTSNLKLLWKALSGLSLPDYDPHSEGFIVARTIAGETITPTKRSAVEAFILAEKAAGRWTKLKRFYLTTSGISSANGIDMCGQGTNALFNAGVTHSPGFVQGNGTSGYLDTNAFPATALGQTASSFSNFALVTQNESRVGTFQYFGSLQSASAQLILSSQSATQMKSVCCDSATRSRLVNLAQADHDGILFQTRIGGDDKLYRRSTTGGFVTLDSFTVAANGAASDPFMYFMAYNNNGVAAGFTDARFGAFGIGLSFTSEADVNAFTLNLKTLYETYTGLTIP